MSAEALKKMREPFKPHQISKLPKPTKQQTDAVKADFKKGIRCKVCGAWHHPEVIHLDYVGHAALTDRLLDVDPMWSWEPLSISPEGLPVLDPFGGMWIKLTVCGVTRLGYGHAGEKSGGDAIKEIIGDALRNAAMRFGAALDLWHKGDLHADDGEEAEEKPGSLEQQLRDSIEQVKHMKGAANGRDVCRMAFEGLQPEIQAHFRRAAPQIDAAKSVKDAIDTMYMAMDEWPNQDRSELKKGIFWLLDSKTRSAINAVEKSQPKQKETAS